jgi:hypothetical protein
MLVMLIKLCVKGLSPLWRSTQCAMRVINKMASSGERSVLLEELYIKTRRLKQLIRIPSVSKIRNIVVCERV